jgi:microcystin-dependent protein
LKFYKGLKRLFETTDLELDDSNEQNRYIEVRGIRNMGELSQSIISVTSKHMGNSIEPTDEKFISVTFYLVDENGTELTNQAVNLPVGWVELNQVYNLYISEVGDIYPFGAYIESLTALSSYDSSGTGFIGLPSAILSIDDTYTSEQIYEAFGSQENIDIFKEAIINKKPLSFYSDDKNILYISVFQSYKQEKYMYTYTKKSGTDSMVNLYDAYKFTVISASNAFVNVSNITNYVFGFTDESHDVVFTKGLNTNIYLHSKMSEHIGSLQEDVVSLKKSASDQVPIGTGMDYFGATPPENYMFADGSAISRTEYSDLFAVIGTTYGTGDGSTTFNLPDKRSRVSVMKDSGTFNSLGKKGGEETHTLTVNEIPSHTHNIPVHGSTNGAASGISKEDADKSAGVSYNITSGSAGGGAAHNNLQPYFVCNYIIKVKYGDSIPAILEGEY